MKKNNKIKFKLPYLRKGSYILFLLMVIFIVYIRNFRLDNDSWFLLNHGKYVFNNGIPYIEPFTIHENLTFVMQQWLSSLIFYICYDIFGIKSLLFLVISCNFLIVFLSYKLCMLISDNNYKISVIVTVIMDILLGAFYVVSRPQIFTFILILLLFYCLELYIKTNKIKFLFLLPIISLLQINLHASMWWMLYTFMLPYLLDGYKFKYFQHDVYKKRPILIAMIFMFIFAFINPYGLDAITYLFKSYGVDVINDIVREMQPVNVNLFFGKLVYFSILAIFCINILVGKKEIKIRYFLLFVGTSYLALSSNKGFSYFLLASLFPVAFYLRDKIVLKKEQYSFVYKVNFLLGFIGILFIFLCTYFFVGVDYENSLDEGIDLLLEKFDRNSINLYVGYNQGGYTEFRGIKSYLDPRAEVFLKANNEKFDIFEEYYQLLYRNIKLNDFIKKYNFSHLLITESEIIYDEMNEISNYSLFYEGKISKGEDYRIYARNDLLS